MGRAVAVLGALLLSSSLAEAAARPAKRSRPPRRPAPLPLVYHVETLDGRIVASSGSDEPVNPASVVKVATTWWALESLGPDHRFETRFRAAGRVDPKAGLLRGDLQVEGGGDPDFQPENAFLVAIELNRMGVRWVTGKLLVDDRFWIGWEGGSAGALKEPERRAVLMASRLRKAFDPRLWDGRTREAWRAVAIRHGLDPASPPRVRVGGGAGFARVARGDLLVAHRSAPLASILRRFNCFSNNDIERIGSGLGPPEQLARLLSERLQLPPGSIELETTSGLGRNRMSPRAVVSLLRLLRETAERLGLEVEQLLPVAGCDPGTVAHIFPGLSELPHAASVAGKTGTLTTTDGGVAVFAGFANTAAGELLFCVAAPRASGRLRAARRQEERFLLELVAQHGGPRPRRCAGPLGSSDSGAEARAVRARAPEGSPPEGFPAYRSQ